MKAAGITAEYDPLHEGHVYHMEQTRSRTGCDVLVVAMSGDFVQRGAPAMLDKWTRCRLALEAGADIVTEIPVQFCLSDASAYAAASVSMLEALGCSHISFGSECGDAGLLSRVADVLRSESARIGEEVSDLMKKGLSYPAARAEAYSKIRSAEGAERELEVLYGSNDILGIEYISNMKSAEPVSILRKGSAHGAEMNENERFCSAGAIRKALAGGADPEEVRGYVPSCTYEALMNERLTFTEEWTEILRYALMSTPAEVLEDCPSGGEGLGNLIKSAARSADSFEDVIMSAKSKRYTYTRLSRLCMQAVLGITREQYPAGSPRYVRILGFSERGREYLSEIKRNESCSLPLITNINKETGALDDTASSMLKLDVRAADIYDLVTGRDVERCSDHVRTPVMIR